MTEPLSAILIGAGQRGSDVYGRYALAHPDDLRFVAVAEEARLNGTVINMRERMQELNTKGE